VKENIVVGLYKTCLPPTQHSIQLLGWYCSQWCTFVSDFVCLAAKPMSSEKSF